jgi:exonuclease SbcC
MISALKITNFQSHKKSIISFGPHVNVIIGRSDSGKTAIIRALRWLIQNRPTGFSFKSDFSDPDDSTEVELTFSDGTRIGRGKTTNDNFYWLDDEVWESFGVDVPDRIKQILNFGPYNIQYQMDRPFLLAETPGNAAQIINKALNLNIIDDIFTKLNRQSYDLKATIKNVTMELEQISGKLSQYEYLPKLADMVNHMQVILADLTHTVNELDSLKGMVSDLQEVLKQYHRFDGLHLANELMVNIFKDHSDLVSSSEQMKEIKEILTKINIYKVEQERLNEVVKVTPILATTEKLNGEYGLLVEKMEKLGSIVNDINSTMMKRDKLMSIYNEMVEKYLQMVPNECPLCGAIITQKEVLL